MPRRRGVCSVRAAIALLTRDQGGPTLAYQVLITPATDYFDLDQPAYRDNAAGYGMDTADLVWLMDPYLLPTSALDRSGSNMRLNGDTPQASTGQIGRPRKISGEISLLRDVQ